jgi:hypothetical protein
VGAGGWRLAGKLLTCRWGGGRRWGAEIGCKRLGLQAMRTGLSVKSFKLRGGLADVESGHRRRERAAGNCK